MSDDLYKMLAMKLGLGNSERMRRLWSMVCGEDEARALLAMPGAADDVARKIGKTPEETNAIIGALFHKGAAFETLKGGVAGWRMAKNLVQFHDASILWDEAPADFVALWREFMDEEYPAIVKMLTEAGVKGFLRVVPVNRAVSGGGGVLPYEVAAEMIGQADSLAVTKCPCRMSRGSCDRPLEACLQMNRGAEYALKRGTGRKLTKDEALTILLDSERAGLVHMVDNKAGLGNVICNCCPCCCEILGPLVKSGIAGIAAPSRFRPKVDDGACNACGDCVDRCPVKAISLKGAAVVDEKQCLGCGLCVSVCALGALALEEVRPAEFIPKV